MPVDDIRTIELRRLHELERQAALNGPKTDPEILIEIQDLHTKYPGTPRNGGRSTRTAAQNEFDFLMTTVAAALVRITKIEQSQSAADDTRQQLLYGIGEIRRWGRVIGVVALVALLIGIVLAVKVF